MAATLRQIAERTGFSIPTVHQILNNYNVQFAAATRAKVLEAASELRYRPNPAARSLMDHRSLLMGVLFYGVNYSLLLNFYRGAQAALRESGYAAIFMTHTNVHEELENVRMALERHVDGIILNVAIDADGSTRRDELLDLVGATPTVEIFGQFLHGVPHARLDYESSAALAVELLCEAGHRSIALLVRGKYSESSERFWSARDFVAGYRAAIRRAALKAVIQPYEVAEDNTQIDAHFHGAYNVAGDVLLKSKPTAVVCYGRESADALIHWCEKNREFVPPGLTIVYFGDPLPASSDIVRLWALPVPAEAVGRMAVEAAFKIMHGTSPQSVRLSPGKGWLHKSDDLKDTPRSFDLGTVAIRHEAVSSKAIANQRRKALALKS